jgi:hypothetical protein
MFVSALTMTVLACAHAPAPVTAADPARGVRNLTADSAEVLAIAMEAAREVRPASNMTKALFGGVYVKGHPAKKTSDALIHANGFASASGSRPLKVECRIESSTGQSRPAPCPRQVVSEVPPVYTFEEVLATADSAYVGMSEVTPDSKKGHCLTLRRMKTSWSLVTNLPIGDAKLCGR